MLSTRRYNARVINRFVSHISQSANDILTGLSKLTYFNVTMNSTHVSFQCVFYLSCCNAMVCAARVVTAYQSDSAGSLYFSAGISSVSTQTSTGQTQPSSTAQSSAFSSTGLSASSSTASQTSTASSSSGSSQSSTASCVSSSLAVWTDSWQNSMLFSLP